MVGEVVAGVFELHEEVIVMALSGSVGKWNRMVVEH